MSFDVDEFLFDTPLYTKVALPSEGTKRILEKLINPNRSDGIHGYNPIRKTETTYKFESFLPLHKNSFFPDEDNFINWGGLATLHFRCKRYDDDFLIQIKFDSDENILMKVGQEPSIASMHLHEIKQYSKVLPKEKMKELTRAIGLAANGVGIGSFVYLRRIFEYLIQEAYQVALQEQKITDKQFQTARMSEKIELLEEFLPAFLVNNKKMYSVLSVGIHELTEAVCLEHFNTLRIGIELILDEKLDNLKKQEKIDAITLKLGNLNNQIKD